MQIVKKKVYREESKIYDICRKTEIYVEKYNHIQIDDNAYQETQLVFRERRDYYSKNLKILNISSNIF